MPLQLQLHPLESGPLKHLPNRQASALQAIQQGFRLDGFVAVNRDLTDARPLRNDDHQHAAVPGDRNVVEVPRREQTFRRRAHCKGVDSIPNPYRQCRKHASRRNALQPLDTNILNHKRFDLRRHRMTETQTHQ